MESGDCHRKSGHLVTVYLNHTYVQIPESISSFNETLQESGKVSTTSKQDSMESYDRIEIFQYLYGNTNWY